MDTKLIIEWSIFALIFLALIYTMIVIKEEKSSFKESATLKVFQGFQLMIPSWWGLKEESSTKLCYERLDTRYDWIANFEWFDSYDESQSIKEHFVSLTQNLQLIFDEDSSAILMPSDFRNQIDVMNKRIDCVRVEGMATQYGTERKYVDLFLLRDLERKGFLFCTSISSILNGLVEGPYFEEVILNIKKT